MSRRAADIPVAPRARHVEQASAVVVAVVVALVAQLPWLPAPLLLFEGGPS